MMNQTIFPRNLGHGLRRARKLCAAAGTEPALVARFFVWIALGGGFGGQLSQKVHCALITQIEMSNQDQLDLLGCELLAAGFLIVFF